MTADLTISAAKKIKSDLSLELEVEDTWVQQD